jgi:hypothetical protein
VFYGPLESGLQSDLFVIAFRRYIGPRTKELVAAINTDDYEEGYDTLNEIDD